VSHRQWSVVALITMIATTVIAALLIYHGQAGGDLWGWPNPSVPRGVSRNGQDIYALYLLISIPAAVVFVGVEGLLLVIIWKWRRSKLPSDYRPPQWSGHTFLELGWTVVPFLIVTLVGAASFHVMQQDEVVPAASEGTVEIHIVAHQFGWKYEYSNGVVIDQELGNTADPMVIPVGRFVRIQLDSTDVIHSFWVPDITGKTDAVPGYSNYTWMRVNEPGEWRGQCTELCGVDHAQMLILVKAIPDNDFQAWLSEQKLAQSQPSPTAAPSPSPSPSPPIASPSPGASPSPTASPSPGASPSPHASPSPSASPSASPSPNS
jgi:cytochrome c oxidase subunit 2